MIEAVLPARAYTEAMSGELRLVPPTWAQPSRPCATPSSIRTSQLLLDPQLLYVSYTPRPELGSASAETSATVRLAQPVSCCQDGLGSYDEQPLPAPDHALSVQPRELDAWVSVVPPTAVTYCEAAGYSTP